MPALAVNYVTRVCKMAATKKNNTKTNNEDIRAQLQALIAKGRKEGTLAISELSTELEKLDLSVEKIEQIYEMFESMGIKVFSNLGDYPEWWQQICDMGIAGFKTNYPDAYTEWWLSTC